MSSASSWSARRLGDVHAYDDDHDYEYDYDYDYDYDHDYDYDGRRVPVGRSPALPLPRSRLTPLDHRLHCRRIRSLFRQSEAR